MKFKNQEEIAVFDQFAASALGGLLASSMTADYRYFAETAFLHAKRMIEERRKYVLDEGITTNEQ